MAKRFLDSKAAVMDALGGLAGVQKLVGATSLQQVENWSRAENFPSRYFYLMTDALRRRGYSAPPQLWGQVTRAKAA